MLKQSKKGFTLVELSIVLVIIGLLIGGILVAQSMIGTARIQSGVRQLGQFDASVSNFYTKFNQLPGDTSVMGALAGDNNGFIGNAAGTTAPTEIDGEVGKFWSDLSASGLKTTGTAAQYTDYSVYTTTPNAARTAGQLVNTVIPLFPVGTNVGVVGYGGGIASNFYMIGSFATNNTGTVTSTPTSALKGADAVAIDAKIDDGVATTGSVLGSDGAALVQANGATDGSTCVNGTAYTTTGTTPVCQVAVRIGLNTGNLQ